MFDDTPVAPQGNAPQNLPVSEPEDLFADTDAAAPAVPSPAPAVAEPQSPPQGGRSAAPSALDAGILKPKEPTTSTPMDVPFSPPPVTPVQSVPSAQDMAAPMNSFPEQPSMGRGVLVTIIIVVAILLLGGAGWWVYRYLNVPETSPTADTVSELGSGSDEESVPTEDTEESIPEQENSADSEDETVVESDTSSTQPVDETILFGDATDTDLDGLDDRREATLGTDPEKVDTDADELSDGDEIIIWGTNPLNPDTDGDTYLDGKEVKAGFSPKGSGKLFEEKIPASTSSIPSP